MTLERRSDTARRLMIGLNGDADQRAATLLLIDAAHGIWLDKLAGWPEYIASIEDPRRPNGLCLDWDQLREDLATDDRAWAAFTAWTESSSGRKATEDECEARLAEMVPRRPWHGASSSELILLRISLELAPGGLLGDGLPRLDHGNQRAVRDAVCALAGDRFATSERST